MKVTALEPQKNNPERLNLHVDGEFRCGIALEIVMGAGLRVGDEITPERLAELERQDVRWKAREVALGLLAYRPRTAEELRRRLARKDFPDDVVQATVDDLAERGFVDDAEFAAMFVRDRVRSKPRGKRRLVQELRARGVAAATAARAVDRTLEEEERSEADLALEAAQAWARRNLTSHRQTDGVELVLKRRLYGYLARRGFDSDAIRGAMARILGGND